MLKNLFFLFFLLLGLSVQAQPPCSNVSYTTTQSGNTVSFTPSLPLTYTITSISWNFGDGGTSTLVSPSHTYANGGYYMPCMTVSGTIAGSTQIFQCTYCDSIAVNTASGPCNASFGYQVASGNLVNFTNTSTGSGALISSNWTFGDGGTSTQQNPSHTYANSGWYNVCVTSVFSDPSTGSVTTCVFCDSVYVQSGIGGPCLADFNYTVNNCTVNFTNYSSGSGILTSCLWNFGDGGTSTAWSPSHTYNATGMYNVCVTVNYMDSTTGGTTSCTYCDSLVWVQCASGPCFADYNYNVSGNMVFFTNTSTGNGTLTSTSWNFGDGGTSTQTNPTHTYTSPGTYNVCVTVIYATSPLSSDTCTYCDSIQVGSSGGPCTPSFTYTQNSANTLNFTNTSSGSGTLTSSFWTFGDGGTSTLTNPTHTYTTGGWFSVCLTVTYAYQGTTTSCTWCDSVYIQGSGGGPCSANFAPSYLSGNAVYFNNTSSGTGTVSSSMWTFGDGGTSTQMSPIHTYPNSGWYNVCLVMVYTTSSGSSTTCTYCDSIYIQSGGSSGGNCFANAAFNQNVSGYTANFNNMSTCTNCTSVSYSWNFGDGSALSTVASPSHTYNASGSYNVCLIITGYDSIQGTCKDTLCKPINVGASSVQNVQSQTVQVYPNPAQEQITVVLNSEQTTTIRILDVSGRVQYQLEAEKASEGISIPVRQLANGLYFIQAESQGERWHGSFLKK